MNKELAKKIVKDTFENKFDKDKFHYFIKNLLNVFEEKKFVYRGNYIPAAYKEYINTLERLGKYKDSEDNEIDILIVSLNKETSLERARSMQRNFVAWYLNGSRGNVLKDAALVAFISPSEADWRFSLVRIEYALDNRQEGKVKIKKELTPAKRFSFLVGNNESSHTAQSRLVSIIEDDVNNPTINQLEEAFNIEKVTKEFFEKYRELFLKVKEELDKQIKNDPRIEKDFEDKSIRTSDFSKKLLGQIVFLYFLQKKGWFGVKRDNDWGTGPKDFLRKLFDQQIITYDNFFNDILEPLFYEALASERPDNFYSRFNSKIPFLNGGLFDPLNNYDWIHTDIKLPNSLFSNKERTAEGDIGTAILDVFDRYNFTVKEDEPLEKEVAVDPEMLGKVFENLLEIKDRKSKGTYYTPREIVHYMCQESLSNYLVAELKGKIGKIDVDTLIKVGEIAVENDKVVTKTGEETATYSYKLPTTIISNAKEIDESLSNIKVCDPAVGSGAFLVGMMAEIVKVRSIISSYLIDGDRSIYTLKHHAIQHNLYGVDIDMGATEIAKLRLWLSLIVEEKDINLIKPLPNLDYKIMQGNSLLQEYEGIKLFDEGIINTRTYDNSQQINEIKNKINELQREFFSLYSKGNFKLSRKTQIEADIKKNNETLKKLSKTVKNKTDKTSLFDIVSEAKIKADKLKDLQKEFFNVSQKRQKDFIKKKINDLTWDLIEVTIKEQKKDTKLKEIEKLKKANIHPFFLWKLNFSDVFEEKKGFDILIANPPYIGEKGHKELFKDVKRESFLGPYYLGKMDYFYFFFHIALILGNDNAVISFITTNYYLTAMGAKKLRRDFKEKSILRNLINFNELKIFESAQGQHNVITILQKGTGTNAVTQSCMTQRVGHATADVLRNILNGTDTSTQYYTVLQSDLYDTAEDYIRISGISTHSTQPHQVVLNKIKKEGVNLGEIFNINQGIVSGADKVTRKHIEKYSINNNVGDGIYVLSDKEISFYDLNEKEKSILKPWYKNSDVHKWYTSTNTNEKLIYADKRLQNLENNRIKSHLQKYIKILDNSTSNSPYLHRPRDINFDSEKIVAPQRSIYNTFGYNNVPWYASADVYYITKRDDIISLKYILGLLNSNLCYFWLYHRGKRKGESLELYQIPLSEIPIKLVPNKLQQPIVDNVDKILNIVYANNYQKNTRKQKLVRGYENNLNQLVYEIYGLEIGERKIVENFSKKHLNNELL